MMGFRVVKFPPTSGIDVPSHENGAMGARAPVRRKARGKAKSKAAYPGKVPIRHAVEAARALGVDIGGIEISANGTIRVLDRGIVAPQPQDEFEQWFQAKKWA